MDAQDWQLIERFGGWVAVLAVVRWMMVRIDKMIDNQDRSVEALRDAIKNFQSFQAGEEETHNLLLSTQREILEQIRDLRTTTSP